MKYQGAYAFPPAGGDKGAIPGIDLQKLKVPGSNQSLYDRWKEIYAQSGIKKAVSRGVRKSRSITNNYRSTR